MRQFDPNHDEIYELNETPDLYLSEEQVSAALERISISKGKGEEEALQFVYQIESLHRNEALDKISHNEFLSEIKQRQDKFVKEFGFWPYAANSYKAFYEQFNKE